MEFGYLDVYDSKDKPYFMSIVDSVNDIVCRFAGSRRYELCTSSGKEYIYERDLKLSPWKTNISMICTLVFPILLCSLAIKLCHSHFVDIPTFEKHSADIARERRREEIRQTLNAGVEAVRNGAQSFGNAVNDGMQTVGNTVAAGVQTAKKSLLENVNSGISWAKKNKVQIIAYGVNKLCSYTVKSYYASIGADPNAVYDIDGANLVSGYYDQR